MLIETIFGLHFSQDIICSYIYKRKKKENKINFTNGN